MRSTGSRTGARPTPLPVAARNGLEVLDRIVLGEDAELDLVAGQVQEGRTWNEQLPDDGVYEAEEP